MTLGWSQLSDFHKHMAEMAEEEYPNRMKNFLRKEVKKLLPLVEDEVNKTTNKKKGRLRRALKAGKVYKYKYGGGSLAIRAYFQNNETDKENSAPHAHLVDKGHNIVPRGPKGSPNKSGGPIKGYIQGRHFKDKAEKAFEDEFISDAQEMLNDLVYEDLINKNAKYKAQSDWEGAHR